jgi:hypothetical protein
MIRRHICKLQGVGGEGLEAEVCGMVRELGLLGLRFRVWPSSPSCTLLEQSNHRYHTACALISGGSCVADQQRSEDEPEVPMLPHLTQNHGEATHAQVGYRNV